MHCRLRWLIANLIVAAPWQSGFGQTTAGPAKPAEPVPESRTQKWEFGISVRAVGGPCAGLVGTFPVPADWPEQQVKVVNEQISPTVQRHSYRAGDGVKQMVFEVPQLSSGATAECFVTLAVTKRAQVPPSDTTNLVIPKDPPREIKKFLNPSPLIEVTNAKVRQLARELPAGKETAWQQVQAIAEGVREKVQFEPDPKNVFKGAIGALRDGKADREDLTGTFVAVCRAAKIPARMVWSMDYCYAEFYLEETPAAADDAEDKAAKGKKPAKATEPKGAWYPCVVHLPVEVGVVNDFRPILEKGDNFKVPEDQKVQRFVKEFLTGKGGTGGKPAVEFRRRPAD